MKKKSLKLQVWSRGLSGLVFVGGGLGLGLGLGRYTCHYASLVLSTGVV